MLTAHRLGKRYGARLVFRDLDFDVPHGTVAAVLGSNGAGKSTLLKIVAGLTRPSAGTLAWQEDGRAVPPVELKWRCGLAAPDAPVYRELTVLENLAFFARARGLSLAPADLVAHLERFALRTRRDDLAGDLSSGLRARLQLSTATLHHPPLLLLDEPSANLDEAGRVLLKMVLAQQREHGLALVATNDPRDVELCEAQIRL